MGGLITSADIRTGRAKGKFTKEKDEEEERKKKTTTPTPATTQTPPSKIAPLIDLTPQKEEKGLIGKSLEAIGIGGKSAVEKAVEEKGGGLKAGTLPITPAGGAAAIATAASKIVGIGKGSTIIKTTTNLITGKVGAVAINTKNAGSVIKLFGKAFSPKTILAVGGSIAVAASTMFLGQWAQAEAPEPISIVMRDVLREAEATGNYDLYNEASEARNEITNLKIWEKILMWTPASVIVGITNKIKGAIEGGVIMDKLAEDKQIQQETGETDDAKWERIRQEQTDQDIAAIDYYNEERKKLVAWELEAKENQRNEDAAFWRKEAELTIKKEAEDRKAIADFWLAYRKEAQKLKDDLRPSNLNFGLI